MTRLWIVMAETYGHKWTTPMGEKPNLTWVEGLRALSNEQWLAGIQILRGSTDEWPPSLPEFRRWCIGAMTKDQMRAVADQVARESLDAKVSRHNPNGTPMTIEQYERELARLSRQKFVQMQENDRRLALGQDPISDSARICVDEEYR